MLGWQENLALMLPPLALCLIVVLMQILIVCAALHPHRCRTHTSAPCAFFSPPIQPTCRSHAKSVSALSACSIAIIHAHESRPHIRLCLYIAGCPRLTDQFDTGFLIILCMACCYLIPWFTLTQVRPHIRLYVSTDLYEYCPPGLQLAATRCPPAWVSIPYVLRYVFLIALIGIGKVEEY